MGLDLQDVKDSNTDWETHVKITNEKRRSWMHAETQPKGYYGTLDLPTTRGNGSPARTGWRSCIDAGAALRRRESVHEKSGHGRASFNLKCVH